MIPFALATAFCTPAMAAGDHNSVTSMNGVEVALKGTYTKPNDVIIQAKLPIIEFDGLTVRGGEQIVKGYDRAFGKGYIAKFITNHISNAERNFSQEQLATALKTTQAFIKDFPEIEAFYQGFAKASGTSFNDVLLASWSEDGNFAHHMLEVKETLFGDKDLSRLTELEGPQKGCTVVGFDNGILGQTMDLNIGMLGETVVWKSNELIVNAVSPFYSGMAMSSNLASNNNTIDPFSTQALDNGAPQSLVYLAALMNSSNVDDAAKLMSKYRTNASGAATLADKNGGLASFEFHADGFKRIDATDNYIVHTNHPIGQEQQLADTITNGDLHAFNRLAAQTVGRYEFADSFMKWDIERTAGSIQSLFKSRPVLLPPTETNSFITGTANVSDINAGCMYATPCLADLTECVKLCFDN